MVLDKLNDDNEYMTRYREDFRSRIEFILSKLILMNTELNTWKEQETRKLRDQIEHELDMLQNPKDCSSAKKLHCKIRDFCGFGCQINDLVYCFQSAYASKRTLVVDSRNWTYDRNGFGDYFKPLTSCRADNLTQYSYGILYNLIDISIT